MQSTSKNEKITRLYEDTEGVLKATKMISFNYWPKRKYYKDFGDNEVEKLISQISIQLPNVPAVQGEIINEWM